MINSSNSTYMQVTLFSGYLEEEVLLSCVNGYLSRLIKIQSDKLKTAG